MEYVNEPYTAIVPTRLLIGPSFEVGDTAQVKEGRAKLYEVKILSLGKQLCLYYCYKIMALSGTHEECKSEEIKYELELEDSEEEDKENTRPSV